jgi:hypothetical protein
MTTYRSAPPFIGENGESLDLHAYNEHIYARREGFVYSNGAMSVANGDLGKDNIPSLTIDSEHVMKEEAALARRDMMLTPTTLYANGVGTASTKLDWFTVPGCSVRWYQPYDTTWTLMQWSMFINYNAWRGRYKDRNSDKWNVAPTLSIQATIDGTRINSTYRRLAPNLFHPVSPGRPSTGAQVGPGKDTWTTTSMGGDEYTGGNPKYVYPEPHSAMHWDLSYGQSLEKGYHEISIQAAMTRVNSEAVFVQTVGSTGLSGTVGSTSADEGRAKFKHGGFFHLTNKLSLGIRNARVLALL